MYKHPLLNRDQISPKEALDILIEGNHRFVNNYMSHKDLLALVQLTKDKQHPFASILSCSDSRAPVEMIFDQALGDIFSVRLAGNIASDKAIGSLEFSTKYLGSKILVVLGHTGCGAVKAACDNFREGHIGEIVNFIRPAVRAEKTELVDRTSKNEVFLEKVGEINVRKQIEEIIRRSDIIQELLESKQIGIAGGVYDLATGEVRFFEELLMF
ncbi:MAG: carbonic anhydrase [Methylophilaceae bacterium]|nr:carbonic anhydrase [Methylophilaceae bacterium]